MGWEDRDYNTGGGGADYLSNPGSILNLSVPFGTWFGVRVRLHFWLLLAFVFGIADAVRGTPVLYIVIGIVSLLAALMFHDFGHRWATMLIGGHHDEFMLWPAGGILFPTAPPGNGPRFVVFVSGMAVNAALAGGCWLALWVGWHERPFVVLNPLAAISMEVPMVGGATLIAAVLGSFAMANWIVALANLLPYYIFDGAYLLQSILGPMLGGFQSINVTCFVGMILTVPMFFLSLAGHNFFGMIFWALLFSHSYLKRKQVQANGTGELDDAIAYSARGGPEPLLKQRWGKRTGVSTTQLMRQAEADRREQGKIDTILAKVSVQGMQSLTRAERKALAVATERQRKRAGRPF